MIDENDKVTIDAFRAGLTCGHYNAVAAPKCLAVSGRRFHGSTTPDAYRDAWKTPAWLFNYFNRMAGGFEIDAAASKANALCDKFWTEQENSLSFDWPEKAKIWLNPPYSAILPWIEHVVNQVNDSKCHVYMLIPDDCSTEWFRLGVDNAAEVYFLTHNGLKGKSAKGGRVGFVNAETGVVGNQGKNGSVVMVFRPKKLPVKTFYIDRTICQAQGDGFF